MTEKWIDELNDKFHHVFWLALDNIRWLVLPAMKMNKYKFLIESNWNSGRSGYMMVGCSGEQTELTDLGSPIALSPLPIFEKWTQLYGRVNLRKDFEDQFHRSSELTATQCPPR